MAEMKATEQNQGGKVEDAKQTLGRLLDEQCARAEARRKEVRRGGKYRA